MAGFGGSAEIFESPNPSAFEAQVVTVTTAGTPVNLPNLPIPDGATLSVRALRSNGRNGIIYLANSSTNTGSATNRVELRRGEFVNLKISNANLVWIDANNNGLGVEILVEQ